MRYYEIELTYSVCLESEDEDTARSKARQLTEMGAGYFKGALVVHDEPAFDESGATSTPNVAA